MSKTPQARIATDDEKKETLELVAMIHRTMQINSVHRQSAANACMFAAAQIITAEKGIGPEHDDLAAQSFKIMLQQARLSFQNFKKAQH